MLPKFLDEYRSFHQREFGKWVIRDSGFKFFLVSIVFLSFLFFLIPRRYQPLVPLIIILFYTNVVCYVPKTLMRYISGNSATLVIRNNGAVVPKRIDMPKVLFANCIGVGLFRFFRLETDPSYYEIKKMSCHILNSCAEEVRLTVPKPDFQPPKKQIIIVNHTETPGRDAFSFFPFIRKTSKMIVLQHNFNQIVSILSRKLWGAWTIDKDDKSDKGKEKLLREMEKIKNVMLEENDELTVVIFPAGKVPKTCWECRNPTKFYPGAFYLSLMTGYPITPLINDYSENGVFSTIVKEPVDLVSEYLGRFIDKPTVKEFREDETNKGLLEEICERFRNEYLDEYRKLEHSGL